MKRRQMSALLVASVAAMMVVFAPTLSAQTTLAWDATKYFQFNIESVDLDTSMSPYKVKIVFSVSDPTGTRGSITDVGGRYFWNIKSDAPFTAGTASRLGIDVGWNTRDFINTGATGETLMPIFPQGAGAGAALPIQINALTLSAACEADSCPGIDRSGRYFVSTFLPRQAVGTGRIGLEGHPVWPVLVNGALVTASVPVKNVFKDFAISDSAAVARRQVVDIAKCKGCHTGSLRDGRLIPRLSLHGGNRTEEPGVCVICHNPNQTDIPYRTSGKEESVDFKRMVHGIHAGGLRTNPLVIIGRGGSVNDFSTVRFPGELRDCLKCHIDVGGKGTFELPLKTSLGSTTDTRSVYSTPTMNGWVSVDPSDDLKITPTAATCSGCHDKAEVRSHMTRMGASFATLQSAIDSGRVKERCVECHGPGKRKDVRRVHEVGGSDH